MDATPDPGIVQHDRPALDWTLLEHSEIGANHVAQGVVNQDAARALRLGNGSVLLCVADGHGSKRYIRSDVGSRLATEVFVALAALFLDGADPKALGTVKNGAEFTMPRMLETRWKEAVQAHLAAHPIPREFDGRPGDPAPDPVTDREDEAPDHIPADVRDQINVYGSTLVGVAIHRDFLVAWQIGDGDVLLVADDGTVSAPLAPEARDLGGLETDSLCQQDAWTYVRMHWMRLGADPPRLVLLSTDGLANSFTDREAFLEFGRDVLARADEAGAEAVQAQLPALLERATSFCGDDVSVAGAWLAPSGETTEGSDPIAG